MAIRIQAVAEPFESADPEALRDAVEAIVLADAMGLVEGDEIERLDVAALRRVARAAAEAGIAALPSVALGTRRIGPDELAAVLRTLREALEGSAVPAREWAAMVGVFGVDELARLVGVSASSLRRYAAGTRATPDPVAARLHFLARVVAELKGAYNDVGVRSGSTAAVLRSPTSRRRRSCGAVGVLRGRAAQRVLALARSLTFSPAT